MKLIVPFLSEIANPDARLIGLAEFLGIECQPISLAGGRAGSGFSDFSSDCLVVNPCVLEMWLGGDGSSKELLSSVTSTFKRMLVHAVSPTPFDRWLISEISGGIFHSVQEVKDSAACFEIASDTSGIGGAFDGLCVGSARTENDCVFLSADQGKSKKLIAINGESFLSVIRRDDAEIFLVGSRDVIDIDSESDDEWLSECFSRFLPHAMVLRHIFAEECWRPIKHHACVIVDDPLLRANYGFLNFKRLLQSMEQHNFHTTIAFIPHNFRRTSSGIAKLFRDHANRLSLCFHGNDHTGGEFASTDSGMLDSILRIAESRMQVHGAVSGLSCERVMVFPQGGFSMQAMETMNSHPFDAAVNTVPHPRQQKVRLTLRELSQPAVFRYGGFPLFLRKNSINTQATEIAFKIFFGIPILIVEHHDVFKNPQTLIEAVNRINSARASVRWCSVGEAVKRSVLYRREPSGLLCIRGYSRTVSIQPLSTTPEKGRVEWCLPKVGRYLGAVRQNGTSIEVDVTDSRVQASVVFKPGSSEVLSIHPREMSGAPSQMSLKHTTRAFVRRRLSEIRDNYISKSPTLLAAAKAVQKSLHHAKN